MDGATAIAMGYQVKINSLRPSGGLALKLWHLIWTPIALFLAFFPLALINLAQFLSLLLLPVSRRAYRAYNRRLAATIWGYWAWGMDHVNGLRIELSGDSLPVEEDAIVIANHQTMSDVIVILCIAFTKGRVGDCKWMVKDGLKYVPGIGWGMLFLDSLFLKRTWADDAEQIRQTFSRYLAAKAPLWLVSFPEGTRLTAAKLEASRAYAVKSGVTPPKHVMLPRPKGFAASVQGLRSHVRAVYSLTITYDPGPHSLVAIVRGDIPRVRLHVRRVEISSMPHSEAELVAWLNADFYRKDALIAANLGG